MVLHNDKWARKAKRASERRKGPTKIVHRGAQEPEPIASLELNRPELPAEAEDHDALSSSASDDSFEFDSGDEGKTEAERAQIAKNPRISNSEPPRECTRTQYEVKKDVSESSNHAAESTYKKIDARYARRRLVDNSTRYEEPILDPYINVPVSEPDYDYRSIATKEFHNPTTIELVPDEKNKIRKPLPMEDTTHFNQMKTMQQKEEYARDLRSRFGQRGYKNDSTHKFQENNDDDFFQEITSHEPVRKMKGSIEPSTDRLATSKSTKEHEPLEKFLDDLLKI